MDLQVYKEQYVLDIYTYDDSFYTVPFKQFDNLQEALNSKKFIRVKDDLIATNSVKKVVKRQLKSEYKESDKYQEMAKELKAIPKELIEQAKQNAQKYKV